nr:hypothetical protein [Enterococcus cecorum]
MEAKSSKLKKAKRIYGAITIVLIIVALIFLPTIIHEFKNEFRASDIYNLLDNLHFKVYQKDVKNYDYDFDDEDEDEIEYFLSTQITNTLDLDIIEGTIFVEDAMHNFSSISVPLIRSGKTKAATDKTYDDEFDPESTHITSYILYLKNPKTNQKYRYKWSESNE